MAEPFISTMWAMTAVFAASVGVWFAIRGARYSRGYRKETEGEKAPE